MGWNHQLENDSFFVAVLFFYIFPQPKPDEADAEETIRGWSSDCFYCLQKARFSWRASWPGEWESWRSLWNLLIWFVALFLLRYGIFVGKCGILVIFFQKVVCELRFEYTMRRWTVFFNHVTWCCRSGECFRNLRLMKLCFWFVSAPRLPPLGKASLLGARFSDALADSPKSCQGTLKILINALKVKVQSIWDLTAYVVLFKMGPFWLGCFPETCCWIFDHGWMNLSYHRSDPRAQGVRIRFGKMQEETAKDQARWLCSVFVMVIYIYLLMKLVHRGWDPHPHHTKRIKRIQKACWYFSMRSHVSGSVPLCILHVWMEPKIILVAGDSIPDTESLVHLLVFSFL